MSAGETGSRDTGTEPGHVPKQYLKIIGAIAVIPGYALGGALVGWGIDSWLGTSPYGIGICVLGGLVMAVRDLMRLKDEFL